MQKHPDNFDLALEAAEKGIVAIPVIAGTKVPAVKWKRWQADVPPAQLLERWFKGTRNSIAIITTGLVVFDCETEAAAGLVLGICGETPHKVKTPHGGIHLGYRKRLGTVLTNRVKIKGLDIDIKTDGGLEMIPPSMVDGVPYEWLGEGLNRISDLPVAKIGWTRERVRKATAAPGGMPITPTIGTPDTHRLLYRGQRYVDRFERAVSGQHGHTTTFLSARKIVRFVRALGGDEAAMWELLRYYNATKCDPAWREAPELAHKLKEALKKA